MQARDELKKEAAATGDNDKYEEYKRLRNKVNTKLKGAESKYYKEKFDEEDLTAAEMWRKAYQFLGKNVSSIPSQTIFSKKNSSLNPWKWQMR